MYIHYFSVENYTTNSLSTYESDEILKADATTDIRFFSISNEKYWSLDTKQLCSVHFLASTQWQNACLDKPNIPHVSES